MAWLAGLVTASTLGPLTYTLIYAYLYTQERRRPLLLWILGWATYLVRSVVAGIGPNLGIEPTTFWVPWLSLLGTLFLLWALAAWRRRTVPPAVAAISVLLCLALLAAAWWFPVALWPAKLLGSIWVAGLRLAGARLIWRLPMPRPVRLAAAVALCVWAGLSPVNIVLAWRAIELGLGHALLTALIEFVVGAGLLAVYLSALGLSLRSTWARAAPMFEQSADIILVADNDGRLLEVNQTACRELGFSRDELLHMSAAALDGTPNPAGGPSSAALAAHLAAASAMGVARGELALRRKGASALPCELHSRCIERDGRSVILAIARDIRERLAADQALAEERARARQYLDLSGTLFVAVNPAGEILLANRSACAALGVREEDVLGRDWFAEFTPAGDRAAARAQFDLLLARDAGDPTETAEERVVTAGGEERLIAWHHVPVRDAQSRVTAVLCSGEDITDSRRAESALYASEQRFRQLVQSFHDVIFAIDAQGRFSDLYGDLVSHGIDKALFLGRTPRDIVGPQEAALHEDAFRRALAGEHLIYEWSFTWSDRPRALQTSLAPLRDHAGAVVGAVAVIRDITPLVSAREALQESERRLSTLLSNMPGMAYRCRNDDHWCMEFVSEGSLELTGYPPEALVGNHDLEYVSLVHPDDRAMVCAAIRQAVDAGRPYQIDYRLRAAAGEEKWVWEQGRGVAGRDGVALEGFIIDVSAGRQAQDALRASEARYRSIFEVAPSLVVSLDAHRAVSDCNARVEELLGVGTAEMLGRSFDLWVDEADRAALATALEQVLRGEGNHHHEYRLRHRSGRHIDVDLHCSLLQDQGVSPEVVCLIEDITERKFLREQLRQMQKMEALGRLAGAVAHDFNNLLTVIGGYGHMAMDALPAGHSVRGDLEHILAAGDRAGSLTRQLLLFSRRHEIDMAILDLNEVLTDVKSMLERLIGENVRLEMRLEPELCAVKADARMVEQALINLAVNARDAMPSGGELRIETTAVSLSPEGASPYPRLQPGRYALLAVSDTGTGMTDEVMEHLFEPFYTTKEPGKGTGLGLSSVYAIVEQMHGDIQVYTALGQGSRFMIYLPATDETQGAPRSAQIPATPHGSETILLIEDQHEVRQLVARILGRLGYTVLVAANAAEASALAREHDGHIDLVLSDVIMPDQMGPEIVTSLRREHPDLRVLFMSGYTDQALEGYGVSPEDLALIQKPFTIQELAARLRKLLDD